MVEKTIENKREGLFLKKYLAKSTQGIITRREKRLGTKPQKARFDWRHPLRKKEELRKKPQPVKEQPKKEITDEELLKDLKTQTHPDLLKKGIELAEKRGLKVEASIQERYKKTEKARENIKAYARELTHATLSATTKEAVAELQTGHTHTAIRDFATIGREGAVGNTLSDASAGIAKNAKVLEKETGKHATSLMQEALRLAAPGNTIDTQKKQDKTDQNLEGNTTKESTNKQVIKAAMDKYSR